jgi:hypothetical protein
VSVHDPDRPERRGAPTDPTSRAMRSDRHPANWLLLLPLVVTLFPPVYNRIDPSLGNIPFFYWYQMAAIVLSVVVTLFVYSKTTRR